MIFKWMNKLISDLLGEKKYIYENEQSNQCEQTAACGRVPCEDWVAIKPSAGHPVAYFTHWLFYFKSTDCFPNDVFQVVFFIPPEFFLTLCG